MALTQKITTTIKNSSGEAVASKTTTVSAASEHEFSITVPGSGNESVVLAIAAADIKAWAVSSDVAVSMEINNPADATIAIAAAGLAEWHEGAATANPIVDDITLLKFVRGSAGDATVRGVFLVDA